MNPLFQELRHNRLLWLLRSSDSVRRRGHQTATMTAFLVTNSGRSAWFVGALVVNVYLVFAMTLYLLPPEVR